MRIAYFIHALRNAGGTERVLTVKANALAEVPGYEIHVITARQRGVAPVFPLSPKVRLHNLGTNENSIRFKRRLNNLLRSIKPDITVSLSARTVKRLPSLSDGSKKVGEFHFTHDKYQFKYGYGLFGMCYADWRTHSLESAAKKLDAFVVLTRADAERWSEVTRRVHQIYNPLTFNPLKVPPLSKDKRAVAVGRLSEEKNFQDAIYAWKIVSRKYPDWTLDIFGEGPLRQNLEGLIAKNGLQGKVRLMGFSANIREEMSRSRFLVMTSRHEGFPMVLLEAMASGIPPVSYNCPTGPREIIDDGRNGFLVGNGNVSELAERIIEMIEGKSTLLAKAALETADMFTMGRIIPQWIELFESLVH